MFYEVLMEKRAEAELNKRRKKSKILQRLGTAGVGTVIGGHMGAASALGKAMSGRKTSMADVIVPAGVLAGVGSGDFDNDTAANYVGGMAGAIGGGYLADAIVDKVKPTGAIPIATLAGGTALGAVAGNRLAERFKHRSPVSVKLERKRRNKDKS